MAERNDVGLCFVAALGCEAKPVTRRWKLGSQRGTDFPVYHNGRDWLVVSGVGKVASAAATAYLRAVSRLRHSVWINVGIAGSGALDRGSAAVAHRVTDFDSGEQWYPALVTSFATPTLGLTTHSTPHTDYAAEGMFDMEAAGFLPMAQRFVGSEWAHSFKIISDTAQDSVQQVSAKRVAHWIEAALPELEQWSEGLRAARAKLCDDAFDARARLLADFKARWRFTEFQQHRLERLLQKWIARGSRLPQLREELRFIGDPQVLLDTLERDIELIPVRLRGDTHD